LGKLYERSFARALSWFVDSEKFSYSSPFTPSDVNRKSKTFAFWDRASHIQIPSISVAIVKSNTTFAILHDFGRAAAFPYPSELTKSFYSPNQTPKSTNAMTNSSDIGSSQTADASQVIDDNNREEYDRSLGQTISTTHLVRIAVVVLVVVICACIGLIVYGMKRCGYSQADGD
jgi:hypothetical protein